MCAATALVLELALVMELLPEQAQVLYTYS